MKAVLYDAKGHDRDVSLEEGLPPLNEQNLLWVDVTGHGSEDLDRLGQLFGLHPRLLADLKHPKRQIALNNYGDYFELDVVTIPGHPAIAGNKSPNLTKAKLHFIVGRLWLITVHTEEIAFLSEFREQDRGETLIGALSPASLTASLLDWHLSAYLGVMESFEVFVDGLDVKMLADKSVRDDLLAQVVAGRRYVSSLRRMLAPQRQIFYGLSRPDFSIVAASNAAEHFKSLEHRFERAVDTVEHGRDLITGSFELFSTRVSETTNVLIRRLTFLSLMLGAIGAVAGIFGMNFETPYTQSGVTGFWTVIATLSLLVLISGIYSWFRKWI